MNGKFIIKLIREWIGWSGDVIMLVILFRFFDGRKKMFFLVYLGMSNYHKKEKSLSHKFICIACSQLCTIAHCLGCNGLSTSHFL